MVRDSLGPFGTRQLPYIFGQMPGHLTANFFALEQTWKDAGTLGVSDGLPSRSLAHSRSSQHSKPADRAGAGGEGQKGE
jgi:hypothetical protein